MLAALCSIGITGLLQFLKTAVFAVGYISRK
ncbi:unknown [Clostridium sp. CAG:440]|nr:unknown [Clostridium sp. CAG:440]